MESNETPIELVHGDWNRAFTGLPLSSEEEVTELITTAFRHAYVLEEKKSQTHKDIAFAFPPEHRDETIPPVAFIIPCTSTRSMGREWESVIRGMYPAPIVGRSHRATITKIHEPTDFEALLEVEFEQGQWIRAMSRHWPVDRQKLRQGDTLLLNIAGLARTVEDTPNKEIRIATGPFFEMARDDFLKENPDKTAADFPFATLDMRGAAGICPCMQESFRDETEIAGMVAERSAFGLLGNPMLRLDVRLLRDTAEELIPIFLPHPGPDDFNPTAGNDITAFVRFYAWPA